jgi:uncharacterized RDD family membrane protein YckC
VRYASLGDRLLAQVVDGAVAVGLFFIIEGVAGPLLAHLPPVQRVTWVAVGAGIVMLVYFVVMESLLGASLGKLVAESRVQSRDSGRLVGLGPILIRNVMRLVDGIGFYLVGGICAMLTPRRQRVGDLVAGTVVVHRPTGGTLRTVSLLLAIAIAAAGVLEATVLRVGGPNGPRIENLILTDDFNGTTNKTTFSPATPRLYLHFTLTEAPLDTVVKASWFAPSADIQGGFPLGGAETRTGPFQSGVGFSIEAPPNGWVPGDYRVDLSVNATPVRTERFVVSAAAGSAPPAAPTVLRAPTLTLPAVGSPVPTTATVVPTRTP